jgi:hypothetical protein
VAATICVMLWAATGQDQLLADYGARAKYQHLRDLD